MTNLCRNFAKIVYNANKNRFYSVSKYQSAISLEKLYPNSSLKLTTPLKPPSDANEKFTGFIPIDELNISYSKSSGPGGQNVNKVNTKVEVRFHLKSASWISNDIKDQLAEKFDSKLTKEGFLIYRSDLTRSQHLNLSDCLEKIRSSVRSCLQKEAEPSAETLEKNRRRIEKAARQRLAIKRERSQVKNNRQGLDIHI